MSVHPAIIRKICACPRVPLSVTSIVLILFCVHFHSYAQLITTQFNSIRMSAEERDGAFGRVIVQIIEESSLSLSMHLGVPEIPVHIIIAPSEKDFRNITGGQIPDWGVAAAQPQTGTLFFKSPRITGSNQNIRIIAIHELCHVMLGNALHGFSAPRWFDEGLALYHSGELGLESKLLLGRSLLLNQTIALKEIDHVLTFHRDKAMLAYRESLSVLEFMVKTFGAELVPRLVQAFSLGQSQEQAILHTTGMSFDSFEKAWYQYLRATYLGYALLDTRFLSSLIITILFILALINQKSKSKKQQLIWENEESPPNADHLSGI
jgi:hypothetical protein